MKYFFISFLYLCSISLRAQNSESSFKVYSGLGYQDVIGPINHGTPIDYVGFELGMEDIYTRGVFLDLGVEISK